MENAGVSYMLPWFAHRNSTLERVGLKLMRCPRKGVCLCTSRHVPKGGRIAAFETVTAWALMRIKDETIRPEFSESTKEMLAPHYPDMGDRELRTSVCRLAFKIMRRAMDEGLKPNWWHSLCSTYNIDNFSDETLDDIENDKAILFDIFPEVPHKEMEHFIDMVAQNMFSGAFNFYCANMFVFSRTLSRINHQCNTASALPIFMNGVVYLYARRDLPAFSELTICYTAERKQMIQKCFCGTCNAPPNPEGNMVRTPRIDARLLIRQASMQMYDLISSVSEMHCMWEKFTIEARALVTGVYFPQVLQMIVFSIGDYRMCRAFFLSIRPIFEVFLAEFHKNMYHFLLSTMLGTQIFTREGLETWEKILSLARGGNFWEKLKNKKEW